MATFSERFKQLRKENNITLEQLANELNTTKTTLSRYENEKRVPDADFIELACKYFKSSADYLLGLSDINSYSNSDDLESKKVELATVINNLRSSLQKTQNELVHNGITLSEDDLKLILDAIEVGVQLMEKRQTELNNKIQAKTKDF